ncbi:MAG: hypothetical protein OXI15_02135 [Chromatiales bacterium]|nr:hypothetical protein [Chromatiales bacterium]
MTIEIHRWRMATSPLEDGRIAVAYDVLVPIDDCPPDHGCTVRIRTNGRHYLLYPNATWTTDLPRGLQRYEAWRRHERAAQRRMLALLHEHCPETRDLTEWPAFWAHVRPELVGDLHPITFTDAAT